MRKFLGLLVILAAVFVGVGWYEGWFHFSTSGPSDTGRSIEMNIDETKMKSDVQNAKEKVGDVAGKATTKSTAK